MSRVTAAIWAVIICLLVSLGWAVNHYRDNATEYKKQRDEKAQALNRANSTIKDMQTRQRDVAALDIKVTQELANAKSEVERLRTGLGNGTKRLRIAASCPKLPETTATTGKPDAASPRYDAEFERNYLSLVERIRQSETMINGLQSYIRTQCQ